jgi:uncharacterized protein involved in exopolysaccharide biosynthesis
VNNTWSLEDLYRGIGRQWRLLLIVTVVFLAAAVAASFLWPVRYQASALLTVEPIAVTQSGNSSNSVNMDTEKVVAKSTTVLAMAAKKLPDSSVAELEAAMEVTVPKNSQVLEFAYTGSNPERAARSANAVATAYSDHRVATAQQVVNEATANLTKRMDDLSAQMAALPANSAAKDSLSLQLQALQERQATLASATFYSGALVSPAAAPEQSTKPSFLILLAAGLFLGVLVGMFSALVRARMKLEESRVGGSRIPEPQLGLAG